MIPIWVWDNRRGTYITLPAPPQQFKSGNWGWTRDQYCSNPKIDDFALCHIHLLDFIPADGEGLMGLVSWDRVELKLKKPPSKWYNKTAKKWYKRKQR